MNLELAKQTAERVNEITKKVNEVCEKTAIQLRINEAKLKKLKDTGF